MKRFKFKLESVLDYRVTLETIAKSAYQEALIALNQERLLLQQFEQSQQELMQSYNIKAGSVVLPETLMFMARYALQVSHLIEQQKKIVLEKEEIAQEKLIEWNKKRMDVKVIENLKEKKWKEYLKEMEKEDQKFQDEIFIAKTIRNPKVEI